MARTSRRLPLLCPLLRLAGPATHLSRRFLLIPVPSLEVSDLDFHRAATWGVAAMYRSNPTTHEVVLQLPTGGLVWAVDEEEATGPEGFL